MASVFFCTVAGGETYRHYAEQLMETAREFFHPSDDVEYLILDGLEGWPNGTLFRYHALYDQLECRIRDYVFLCDADMRFEAPVGPEVIPPGGIAATLHPGYVESGPPDLPFEERMESAAYVKAIRRLNYYAGGFVGGRADAMWTLCKWVDRGVRKDIGRGMIARWHDESHLNCYLAEVPPVLKLTPSMCYPDNDAWYKTIWSQQYERKLVALDKTREERGER